MSPLTWLHSVVITTNRNDVSAAAILYIADVTVDLQNINTQSFDSNLHMPIDEVRARIRLNRNNNQQYYDKTRTTHMTF